MMCGPWREVCQTSHGLACRQVLPADRYDARRPTMLGIDALNRPLGCTAGAQATVADQVAIGFDRLRSADHEP